jgi:23S rRNA (adenine2030-N6)-methyltransferase
LSVEALAADGFGMFGSGMFVINPPWTLAKTLEDTLPVLAKLLGKNNEATFRLTHN